MYSSSAGTIKKEIEEYKLTLNSEHKIFYDISQKFYESKFEVTKEKLVSISETFKVDCNNIKFKIKQRSIKQHYYYINQFLIKFIY